MPHQHEWKIENGINKRENYISFCEFYKETTDVKSFEDLCLVSRENVTVIDMLNSLNDNDISIY